MDHRGYVGEVVESGTRIVCPDGRVKHHPDKLNGVEFQALVFGLEDKDLDRRFAPRGRPEGRARSWLMRASGRAAGTWRPCSGCGCPRAGRRIWPCRSWKRP